MVADDRSQFEEDKRRWARAMASDPELARMALEVVEHADRHHWTYQWSWLGLPIIQMPPDIVAMQEVIWSTQPELIIETGIARGGSLVLYASVLEVIGRGMILGIDVDIRPHNRESIEGHLLSHRIRLLEGSSTDPATVREAARQAASMESVMVVLDSNHTHEHVLAELEAYAPLVTSGQYLVVADTVVEDLPEQTHRPRPWGIGNNPATALEEFLTSHQEFEVDEVINSKVLLTSSPGGYLRRIR